MKEEPLSILRALREEPLPIAQSVDAAEARKERMVPAIERAILREAEASRTRAVRRRIAIGAVSIAAAAAALIFVTTKLGTPSPDSKEGLGAPGVAVLGGTPDRGGAPPVVEAARLTSAGDGVEVRLGDARRVPAPGGALERGATVTTNAGAAAEIVTVTGAALSLSESSVITLAGGDASDERVSLSRGRMTVSVPKGTASRTFVVDAPRATVVVHGTRFTVTVAEDGTTLVEVSEGTVGVRATGAASETLLYGGDQWSSAKLSERSATANTSAKQAPTSSPSSDLALQNARFEEAMKAKQRGDDTAVIQKLDAFLAQWPESPLAPDARLERQRAATRIAARKSHGP